MCVPGGARYNPWRSAPWRTSAQRLVRAAHVVSTCAMVGAAHGRHETVLGGKRPKQARQCSEPRTQCMLTPVPPPPGPADGFPELRTLLAIGGVDMKTQADQVRNSGIHMVVATPGRLKDMLT